LGALRYAAATLGWSIELLAEWSDKNIEQLLGLDRDDFKKMEHESPDIICRINTHGDSKPFDATALLEIAQSGTWFGKADSLRAYHLYKWPIIDEVATAASKPRTEEPEWQAVRRPPGMAAETVPDSPRHFPHPCRSEVSQSVGNRCDQHTIKSSCTLTATEIARQRRSAQQFDGKMSPLPQIDFYRMLAAVLPSTAAFELWRWPPKIHLFIFVHRVEGLAPGLYALPRHDNALEKLQAATLTDFDWQKAAETIPLYHLYSGDYRLQAKTLSCHQPIASDSAFSLGMVAEFDETIETTPWLYRRLFWECGLIGQVLYLEAEAAGIRGTGIGCYFDDSVHELLGLKDEQFQSLYHFTVGKPLEDSRLQTFPAYGHLKDISQLAV